MNIPGVSPRIANGTDGLASAYQRTQITGASIRAVRDTAGRLLYGVTGLPTWQAVPIMPTSSTEELPENNLPIKMTQNALFKQVTERGLAELEQGRYSKIEEVKRRLGDI